MGLIESLLVLGLLGLLVLLRLDAPRFGVAEYDDSGRTTGWRPWARRLAWFGLGLALVLLVYWLHPQPVSVLHLDMGPDRERSLLLGLLLGVAGIVLAFLYAWIRYAGFRLPAPRAYPGAIVNSIGTALIDEAVFRGIMLGLLLHQGIGLWPAIAIQAVVYGIATRLLARGRSKGMLFIDLVLAVAGGWLVAETLGIGAAVLGHTITRFAVFLATGHSDQARPVGWEPEDVEGRALPPQGWDVAGRPGRQRSYLGPPQAYDPGMPPLGAMYAGQSPFAGQGYLPPEGQGYPPPEGQGYPPPEGQWQAPPGGPGPWQPGPWDVPPGMTGAPPMGPGMAEGTGYPPTGPMTGDPGPPTGPMTGDPGADAWTSAGPWVADPATGAWSPAPRADAPSAGDADGGQRGQPA